MYVKADGLWLLAILQLREIPASSAYICSIIFPFLVRDLCTLMPLYGRCNPLSLVGPLS